MKLFDFFKKKDKEEMNDEKLELKIYSPTKGKLVDITMVPDATFSEKMLGDGVAIIPDKNGLLCAPVDGRITQLINSLHAFTMETEDGVNILVHFGINTVQLKGEGLKAFATEGDFVKAGDKIIEYDYELITQKGYDTITSVIILDSEEYDSIDKYLEKDLVDLNSEIITVKKG